MTDAPTNMPEFSVSELSAALKKTVEDSFSFVRVRGEVSGYRGPHSSGHVYFALKDDNAKIDAIIWKGSFGKMKVRPEEGIEVIATGRLTTYPGRSSYQIVIENIELAGIGALLAMLEKRRAMLAAEGLFDVARKRALPFLPEVIGVVTSPTGAVIRDIMHRLNARFPRRVLLWPVSVQGEKAAAEVAAAINGFNAMKIGGALPRPDLIIVARGGGSLEDLMAFNEEIVVRAVAACTIPLISAVGHETDTTLIDFVSDMRAPTPTAAAEMAVPIRTELLAQTMDFERRVLRAFTKAMDDRRRHVAQLARVLPRADQLFAQPRQRFDQVSERLGHALRRNLQEHRRAFTDIAPKLQPAAIKGRIALFHQRTESLVARLARSHTGRLASKRQQVDSASRQLKSVSYESVLSRGYALVRGEDGSIRRRADAVHPGESLSLTFGDGVAGAVATGEGAPKPKTAGKKPGGNQGSLF